MSQGRPEDTGPLAGPRVRGELRTRDSSPSASLFMTSPRISVVLPVYNEHLNIEECLRGLWRALEPHEHEILVCYDFDADSTLPAIAAMKDRPPSVRLVKNEIGRGAANALRAGFQAATGDVIVTTMADLCDPPEVIPLMAEKMRREGCAVVSGSRYAKGGSQTGGPLFKRICSQTASLTLKWFSGMSTADATSNFRAYSRSFIQQVQIESKQGFEIALELTVKAHLAGLPIAEVPSSWKDRSAGESRFRIWKWMPNYLRWYWEAMAAPAFVLVVFAAMLAAAHVFVARYSSTIPLWDDLEWAPYIHAKSHIPADWWWSPFNEHRIPLPRVFFLALMRTYQDFRSGMYFDVYLLGAVALAMILLARKLRGRTSYTDAFFPLLWLTWGNYENLLMMHQISLILPSAITCVLLMLFTVRPQPPGWKKSLVIGLCLFSLPLCGAPGLTPAPAITLWLLYTGWRRYRSEEAGARASGVVLLTSAVATIALIAFYFYDFENPRQESYSKDPLGTLLQSLMFLALGFGPAAREYWPLSGWLIGTLMLGTLGLLLLVFKNRPQERYRVAGLLAISAGIVSMALATGIARGGGYEYAGFAVRYVTLPSPMLCCVYFAFCLYGAPSLGRLVRISLYSLLVLLVFYNARHAANYGQKRADWTATLFKEVSKGVPLKQVALKHWKNFYNDPAGFYFRLETLSNYNFGPLAGANTGEPDYSAYNMLKTRPFLISSMKAQPAKLGDEHVLMVPPGCQVHFSLNQGEKTAKGRFGIHPLGEAFTPRGGLRFQVLLTPVGEETRTLLDRVLDPRERPEDQGPQNFEVSIPDYVTGVLVLRTNFGGEAGDDRPIGYWTDVEVR